MNVQKSWVVYHKYYVRDATKERLPYCIAKTNPGYD